VFVETPTHLNARQKELMRELADLCGEQQHPQASGFMGKARKVWDGVTGQA
jgi:molecular chaperone DnaJ